MTTTNLILTIVIVAISAVLIALIADSIAKYHKAKMTKLDYITMLVEVIAEDIDKGEHLKKKENKDNGQ